jgi:hypothetical protein
LEEDPIRTLIIAISGAQWKPQCVQTMAHGFDKLCGNFHLDILDSFEDPQLSPNKVFPSRVCKEFLYAI